MELLCLTGVEDKLQVDVRPTLELLRNAAIKVGKFVIFLVEISLLNLSLNQKLSCIPMYYVSWLEISVNLLNRKIDFP